MSGSDENNMEDYFVRVSAPHTVWIDKMPGMGDLQPCVIYMEIDAFAINTSGSALTIHFTNGAEHNSFEVLDLNDKIIIPKGVSILPIIPFVVSADKPTHEKFHIQLDCAPFICEEFYILRFTYLAKDWDVLFRVKCAM